MPSGPFGGPRPLAKCRLFFNIEYRVTGQLDNLDAIERMVKEELERKEVMNVSDTGVSKTGNVVSVTVGTNDDGLTNDEEDVLVGTIKRVLSSETNFRVDFQHYEFSAG